MVDQFILGLAEPGLLVLFFFTAVLCRSGVLWPHHKTITGTYYAPLPIKQ